jgi:superfamily II DNA/RNA helicase
LVEKLAERDIREATAVQERVIPKLLEGSDIAFRSATGTGKTFAYLLPIVQAILAVPERGMRGPIALISAPTYELCSQIKAEAEFIGGAFEPKIKASLLTGDANMSRQIDKLKSDKPEIVVGTSARIAQIARMGKLKLKAVKYLVLDEADRLLADELRDTTLTLAAALSSERVTVACSATLPRKAREHLAPLMREGALREELDDEEVLRSMIEHWAFFSEGRKKIQALRSFLLAAKPEKTLVFTDRGGQVGNILGQLRHHGISASGLYGDMDKIERKKAIDDFRAGRATVLVTSDLSARGLDIGGVSHIVELDVPSTADAYAHRAGRTARAGKRGIMATIGDEIDLPRLAALEKKLHIVVQPKDLYGGKISAPEAVDDDAVEAEIPEEKIREKQLPRRLPEKKRGRG